MSYTDDYETEINGVQYRVEVTIRCWFDNYGQDADGRRGQHFTDYEVEELTATKDDGEVTEEEMKAIDEDFEKNWQEKIAEKAIDEYESGPEDEIVDEWKDE